MCLCMRHPQTISNIQSKKRCLHYAWSDECSFVINHRILKGWEEVYLCHLPLEHIITLFTFFLQLNSQDKNQSISPPRGLRVSHAHIFLLLLISLTIWYACCYCRHTTTIATHRHILCYSRRRLLPLHACYTVELWHPLWHAECLTFYEDLCTCLSGQSGVFSLRWHELFFPLEWKVFHLVSGECQSDSLVSFLSVLSQFMKTVKSHVSKLDQKPHADGSLVHVL